MARLALIGTGTCQLEDGRTASSVLVELDGLRLVFDCGRGVAARLAELGYRQDQLRHVVVSHFHADHVSDLVPLLQAGSWSRTDPRSRDLEATCSSSPACRRPATTGSASPSTARDTL
jgi:ribonuclease BN (tRNA processing enzyme)